MVVHLYAFRRNGKITSARYGLDVIEDAMKAWVQRLKWVKSEETGAVGKLRYSFFGWLMTTGEAVWL
jgi:hypothetical protein